MFLTCLWCCALLQVVVAHNVFLSASSLVMFVLLAIEFREIFKTKTFFQVWKFAVSVLTDVLIAQALCDEKGDLNRGRHYVLYTVNYWFKVTIPLF
jgi:hypothetical protein